jgi:DNA-nicking Smr family endonuclease
MNEDEKMFKEAMKGVKPIELKKNYTYKSKIYPRPFNVIKDNSSLVLEALGYSDLSGQHSEGVVYSKSRLKHQLLKKFTKGKITIESDIDLHGLTSLKARSYLKESIKLCHKEGLLCVRVIHGKGLRSGNQGPVLKEVTYRCLGEMDEVSAFVTAKNSDGGSGAVYVLLGSSITSL